MGRRGKTYFATVPSPRAGIRQLDLGTNEVRSSLALEVQRRPHGVLCGSLSLRSSWGRNEDSSDFVSRVAVDDGVCVGVSSPHGRRVFAQGEGEIALVRPWYGPGCGLSNKPL